MMRKLAPYEIDGNNENALANNVELTKDLEVNKNEVK